MASPNPETQPQALEKTVRHLLSVTTTILVLLGIAVFASHFYNLLATMGMVLVVTYVLLGPVNLMEQGILGLSRRVSRLGFYRRLTQATPEANPRILAVLIVYFVFFMSLTIGTIQFVPVLNKQLEQLGSKIGQEIMTSSDQAINWAEHQLGEGTIRNWFARDIEQAEREGIVSKPAAPAEASVPMPVTQEEKQVIQKSMLQRAIVQLQETFASAVPHFISFVGGTMNGFVYFLTGILLTFYFLSDAPRIKRHLLEVLPPASRETASYLLGSFHQVMFSFIKGQVLLGLLTGLYMYGVYTFFGVPWAVLLGVIFAIAEILPVVGTWIGMGVGLAVILLTMDPIVALWVWLCSYAYQTVKDNILAPKIVGDVMGLHPMVVILALLIGAKVAGLLGVLFAMPLASAVYVIIRLLLKKDAQQKEAIAAAAMGGEESGHAA